jgi:hypothetical protein
MESFPEISKNDAKILIEKFSKIFMESAKLNSKNTVSSD